MAINLPHQTLTIDVNRRSENGLQCLANVNDENTRFVDVKLVANGSEITLDGCTATATFVTDGILISDSIACTINTDSKTISVPLERFNTRSGIMSVQLKIESSDSEEILNTPIAFKVKVTSNITTKAQIAEISYGSTAEILKEVVTARNGCGNLNERFAKLESLIDAQEDKPKFANSIEECTNTERRYVLPDGYIYAYEKKSTVSYPNIFDKNTASLNSRLGTDGTVSKMDGYATTDFISVKLSDLDPYPLHINGKYFTMASNTRISLYNNSKVNLATYYLRSTVDNDKMTKVYSDSGRETIHVGYYGQANTKLSTYNDVAYIRLTFALNAAQTAISATDVANIEITSEAIKNESTKYEWTNTGFKYEGELSVEQRLINVETSVEDLTEAVQNIPSESNASIVPDYWKTSVNSAISKIKSYQNSLGNQAVNFAFFSDMHVSAGLSKQDCQNIGTVAAAVMDECDIPFAVCAGDTNTQGDVDNCETERDFEIADEILKPIGKNRLLRVIGNHDGVWGNSTANGTVTHYTKTLPLTQMYNIAFRGQSDNVTKHFGGDGTYFYVDDTAAKMRYICLNAFDVNYTVDSNYQPNYNRFRNYWYGQTQLEWLTKEALNVKDGWTIAIVTHVPPTSVYENTSKDLNVFKTIIKTYINRTATGCSANADGNLVSLSFDFTNAKGVIAGIFCGHCHKDSIVTDVLPCPIVSITCAVNTSYDSTEPKRTAGTNTETALDIVTIDKLSKKIYCTRLGVGKDREASFGG